MYEAKQEREIHALLYEALDRLTGWGLKNAMVVPFPLDTNTEEEYSAMKITDYYHNHVDSSINLPAASKLREDGRFIVQIPKDKPLVPLRDIMPPGSLDTSTGYINFFSPLRYMRAAVPRGDDYMYWPGGFFNSTVSYQPTIHGWESFFKNGEVTDMGKFEGYKSPLSQRIYKLLHLTNKARNRAHTTFDSAVAIKDQFPQVAKMHPSTAAKRGVKDGDLVYVYNDRGCTKIPAKLTGQIIHGVVSIEHGAWYRAHPTERVKVWMQDGRDANNPDAFHEIEVPVDIGGAENLLTNDYFGEDTIFCGGACPAQTGPCEVSIEKPE
jgi:anaerobic dimethyl sulfoxide reductase subunit A